MSNAATEIPACPDSIRTVDGRVLWMELMEEQIAIGNLNAVTLETAKSYVHAVELSDLAMKEIRLDPDSEGWNEVFFSCANRMLECVDILKITPKSRGLI